MDWSGCRSPAASLQSRAELGCASELEATEQCGSSVSASTSRPPHLGSLFHLEMLPCNCTEMAVVWSCIEAKKSLRVPPVWTLKPPASFTFCYFLLLRTFPSPLLHLRERGPVDIPKGLVPTGLGRTSLAHCTLLTFFMHMQLIKTGQNFKALAIFRTDYEFYVLCEALLKLATHKD